MATCGQCHVNFGCHDHCGGCHCTFSSLTAFDMHQRLTSQGLVCLDPSKVLRRDGTPLYELHGGWLWRRLSPGRGPHPKSVKL